MYTLSLSCLDLCFIPEERTRQILLIIKERNYQEASILAQVTVSEITTSKDRAFTDKEKNEGFIWVNFFSFLTKISLFWSCVEGKKYYKSWGYLQDALDALRCLKKFYSQKNNTLCFFEKQLLSLEKLYPYTVFTSAGFIESGHECSICQLDMDSDDCFHLKGELYSGELALAIVKKIERLDHLALVDHPRDKRQVVGINDSHPSFKVFDDLMSYFDSQSMTPLNFNEAITLEFKKKNLDWVKIPRNDKCYCGSGFKFKKCCMNKKYMEQIHIQFAPCNFMT